ncbi:hypothetical protein D6745_00600 [Candidatus Woesearchaeota archaeon]|nr:MAG: hypothetical protein D6745_00600 [Candidatus Woesearchaeota archaeon]
MFEIIFPRMVELLQVPLSNPITLWEIIPLFITMFVMELYFARNRDEELGWNTALGNSMVLIFVGASILRYQSITGVLTISSLKTVIPILLIFFSFILAFFDFFHMIPQFIAFRISSKLPLNYLAYLVVVYSYTEIPFDNITIFAAIIMFFLILIFFLLVKHILSVASGS